MSEGKKEKYFLPSREASRTRGYTLNLRDVQENFEIYKQEEKEPRNVYNIFGS